MVDEITVPISERSTPWCCEVRHRSAENRERLDSITLKTPFYAFGRHAELTWLIPGSGLAPSFSARAEWLQFSARAPLW